jgi:hypothetical protein
MIVIRRWKAETVIKTAKKMTWRSKDLGRGKVS